MKFQNIVFESPSIQDRGRILSYLRKGKSVYVIEPFHAFHHRSGIRFYPKLPPAFINHLLERGKIQLLPATLFKSRESYLDAAQAGVAILEDIFPLFQKDHRGLASVLIRATGNKEILNLFKKVLCEKLAEVYSVNSIAGILSKHFPEEKVTLVTGADAPFYHYLMRCVEAEGSFFQKHPNVSIANKITARSLLRQAGKIAKSTAHTCILGIASLVGTRNRKQPVRSYEYGIAVVSPRQLQNNQRGADFLFDLHKHKLDQAVFCPLFKFTREQLKKLNSRYPQLFFLPKRPWGEGKPLVWAALLFYGLRSCRKTHGAFFEVALKGLLSYYRWEKALRVIRFKNFITHCDFDYPHIPRNMVLNREGVRTWYFTDSGNSGLNYRREGNGWNLHPFWTYLAYDHLVTWSADLRKYYFLHPGSPGAIHVAGCVWADHIRGSDGDFRRNLLSGLEEPPNCFFVVAYPSTYTVNGFTCYEEGIQFLQDLYRLTLEKKELVLLVKEKQDWQLHQRIDPVSAQKLLSVCRELESCKRVRLFSKEEDSSLLAGVADLSISFPFTSTTAEALSRNKPAIWHDAGGFYRDTPYAKVKGLVSHSYNELTCMVTEIMNRRLGPFSNPVPAHSPLLDPFRDGRAIERFWKFIEPHSETHD